MAQTPQRVRLSAPSKPKPKAPPAQTPGRFRLCAPKKDRTPAPEPQPTPGSRFRLTAPRNKDDSQSQTSSIGPLAPLPSQIDSMAPPPPYPGPLNTQSQSQSQSQSFRNLRPSGSMNDLIGQAQRASTLLESSSKSRSSSLFSRSVLDTQGFFEGTQQRGKSPLGSDEELSIGVKGEAFRSKITHKDRRRSIFIEEDEEEYQRDIDISQRQPIDSQPVRPTQSSRAASIATQKPSAPVISAPIFWSWTGHIGTLPHWA